ncbi:MAG: transcriptional regulator, CdaR [Frankiales bacterium]|nr:transcriptional regulator, CdaR [Frankiales bacterium]
MPAPKPTEFGVEPSYNGDGVVFPALTDYVPQPPDGWGPVARLCQCVRENLDELTVRVAAAITSEIPDYAQGGNVPLADLSAASFRNLDMMLLGLAENRSPREDELAIRGELGRHRARQGLPLQSLVAAYHVGYREVWSELVIQARAADDTSTDLLLEGSATLWSWIHGVITAVGDGYLEEIGRSEAADARARAHLFDLIRRNPDSAEASDAASDFGFQPNGSFQAFVLPAPGASFDASAHLRDAARQLGAIAATSERGYTVITLVQAESDAVRAQLVQLLSDQPAGVGLERSSLQGARLSILDAEQAAALASLRHRCCVFEQDWLEAVVLAQEGALAPLFATFQQVARRHPHLALTVRTFAGANLSLAETSRRLLLSPNSVRSRLDRWKKLTGSDPWTLRGAVISVLAVETGAKGLPDA